MKPQLLLTLLALVAGCDRQEDLSPPASSTATYQSPDSSPAIGELAKAPVAPQRPPTGDDSSWVRFTSPDGDFAVSFPVEPVDLDRNAPKPAGKRPRMFIAVPPDRELKYSVAIMDQAPPEDAKKNLRDIRNGYVHGHKGTLLKESDVRFGDWHEMDFSQSFEVNGRPNRQFARVILLSGRFIVLSVLGHPDRVSEQDADEFFRTFILLDKK